MYVRKRTFRGVCSLSFDTAVIGAVPGCEFPREPLTMIRKRPDRSPQGTSGSSKEGWSGRRQTPSQADRRQFGPGRVKVICWWYRDCGLCEKFLEASCWVVDRREWPGIKEPTCEGSRLAILRLFPRFSCLATAMLSGPCLANPNDPCGFDGERGKTGDVCESKTRRPVCSFHRDGLGYSSHRHRSRVCPPGFRWFRP